MPVNLGAEGANRGLGAIPHGRKGAVSGGVSFVERPLSGQSAVPERFRTVSLPGASPVADPLRSTSEPTAGPARQSR